MRGGSEREGREEERTPSCEIMPFDKKHDESEEFIVAIDDA